MSKLTETAIKDAFLSLLEEKNYDAITVRDIAERCGINRNTFYYHFPDIPGLMEQIVHEGCDRVIARYPSLGSIRQCLAMAMEFVGESRKIIRHIYSSGHRELFEQQLWRLCAYAVTSYAEPFLEGRKISDADKTIILGHYECVCFGHVMQWLDDDMPEQAGDYLDRLCTLKEGQLEEMIRRCETA